MLGCLGQQLVCGSCGLSAPALCTRQHVQGFACLFHPVLPCPTPPHPTPPHRTPPHPIPSYYIPSNSTPPQLQAARPCAHGDTPRTGPMNQGAELGETHFSRRDPAVLPLHGETLGGGTMGISWEPYRDPCPCRQGVPLAPVPLTWLAESRMVPRESPGW